MPGFFAALRMNMAQRFFGSLLSDPLLQAPLIQTDKILCQAFFREAAQSELCSKTTHTLRKQGTSDQVGQRPSHHRRFPPAQKDAVVENRKAFGLLLGRAEYEIGHAAYVRSYARPASRHGFNHGDGCSLI